jgi:hypothetical protein
MGYTMLRSIAETLGMAVDHDPDPDGDLQLSYEEYLVGIARISSTSFRMERSPEEAWPDFRGWRVNYESIAYALAERMDAVPAPWTGPRRTGDTPREPLRPVNRMPTAHHALSRPEAPRSAAQDRR